MRSISEAGVGTILWLIVDQNYRNKGIGTNLFNQITSYYKNIGCHKLKLTAPNQNAVNFYNKLGMGTEGYHRKHWYSQDFWSLGLLLD
jgi:ribosomal protein S18 acetylase RimI-like enzyme